ncbi:hypothetical protein Pyn_10245 [Prunus yedoensis var. nudiflora]|uniref:Uncharacterized protein n=1 Tax=Prunus yedoensis var. nudiflora TaxID=2094558 RepID=A0A314UUE5_PRUYE|nr:hypothetical protein Pyn_10245 [Prunus yedoensis var. nudiflora]
MEDSEIPSLCEGQAITRKYCKRHGRSSMSPRRPDGHDEHGTCEDSKKEKKEKTDGTDHPDPKIAEANRLRASLGLKPLKM